MNQTKRRISLTEIFALFSIITAIIWVMATGYGIILLYNLNDGFPAGHFTLNDYMFSSFMRALRCVLVSILCFVVLLFVFSITIFNKFIAPKKTLKYKAVVMFSVFTLAFMFNSASYLWTGDINIISVIFSAYGVTSIFLYEYLCDFYFSKLIYTFCMIVTMSLPLLFVMPTSEARAIRSGEGKFYDVDFNVNSLSQFSHSIVVMYGERNAALYNPESNKLAIVNNASIVSMVPSQK